MVDNKFYNNVYFGKIINKITISQKKKNTFLDNMLSEIVVVKCGLDIVDEIDKITNIRVEYNEYTYLTINVIYSEKYRPIINKVDYYYIFEEDVIKYIKYLEHLEGDTIPVLSYLYNDLVDYFNCQEEYINRINDYEQISTIGETQIRLKNMNKKKSARKIIN